MAINIRMYIFLIQIIIHKTIIFVWVWFLNRYQVCINKDGLNLKVNKYRGREKRRLSSDCINNLLDKFKNMANVLSSSPPKKCMESLLSVLI